MRVRHLDPHLDPAPCTCALRVTPCVCLPPRIARNRNVSSTMAIMTMMIIIVLVVVIERGKVVVGEIVTAIVIVIVTDWQRQW